MPTIIHNVTATLEKSGSKHWWRIVQTQMALPKTQVLIRFLCVVYYYYSHVHQHAYVRSNKMASGTTHPQFLRGHLPRKSYRNPLALAGGATTTAEPLAVNDTLPTDCDIFKMIEACTYVTPACTYRFNNLLYGTDIPTLAQARRSRHSVRTPGLKETAVRYA